MYSLGKGQESGRNRVSFDTNVYEFDGESKKSNYMEKESKGT